MYDLLSQIEQGKPSELGLSPTQLVDLTHFMKKTGAGMRLDKLQSLMASISPDLVPYLLTQNITAKLLKAYHAWNDDWKLVTTQGKSDYLDTQYLERMAQLGMVGKLKTTGEDFRELNVPDADQITYDINGYGNMVTVDLRTKRSDRLGYFSDLGESMGRACVSRLHQTIFVDFLQGNPTVDDSNSLFDSTNHGNDNDSGSAGKALTYDNIVACFRLLDAMVDDASEPLGADFGYLVVGRYWREIADQIVNDPQQPGTSNRNVNTIRQRIKKVIYSRKLTYDWYLLADPKELPGLHIDFFEGEQEPKVEAEKNDSTFQFEHPGRQRWRIYHYYGPVWKYWQAAIRGSTNNLAT